MAAVPLTWFCVQCAAAERLFVQNGRAWMAGGDGAVAPRRWDPEGFVAAVSSMPGSKQVLNQYLLDEG